MTTATAETRTRKANPANKLVLMIVLDEPRGAEGYAHVRAYPEVRQPDGHYRSPHAWYHEDEGREFAGVHLGSQTDTKHLRANGPHLYAVNLEFSGNDAGLEELRRGVKALAKIQRRLDALEKKDGRPGSIGLICLRLARALGTETIAIRKTTVPYWEPIQATEYRLADGADAIDAAIARWHYAVTKTAD